MKSHRHLCKARVSSRDIFGAVTETEMHEECRLQPQDVCGEEKIALLLAAELL